MFTNSIDMAMSFTRLPWRCSIRWIWFGSRNYSSCKAFEYV